MHTLHTCCTIAGVLTAFRDPTQIVDQLRAALGAFVDQVDDASDLDDLIEQHARAIAEQLTAQGGGVSTPALVAPADLFSLAIAVVFSVTCPSEHDVIRVFTDGCLLGAYTDPDSAGAALAAEFMHRMGL